MQTKASMKKPSQDAKRVGIVLLSVLLKSDNPYLIVSVVSCQDCDLGTQKLILRNEKVPLNLIGL